MAPVVPAVDVVAVAPTAFLGFRPTLAFGKSIGIVDFQIHAGAEMETRPKAHVRPLGGFNVTVDVDENVSVFTEGNLYMGGLTFQDGDTFRFNTASFGLKFYPKVRGESGNMEVNIGASLPVAANYWMYHFGAIMAQVVYYMPGPDEK